MKIFEEYGHILSCDSVSVNIMDDADFLRSTPLFAKLEHSTKIKFENLTLGTKDGPHYYGSYRDVIIYIDSQWNDKHNFIYKYDIQYNEYQLHDEIGHFIICNLLHDNVVRYQNGLEFAYAGIR